jgi:hypothetical protein
MRKNQKADYFLSNFITCVSWLAAEKRRRVSFEDFIFYRKTDDTYNAFKPRDLGIRDENQAIKLPNVNKTVIAKDFIKDVNELEKWLNKKGFTLRGRLAADNGENKAGREGTTENGHDKVNAETEDEENYAKT